MHGTGGRPPFKPTPSQRRRVERMAAKGISRREIADVIGVSRATLDKYFGEECKRGHAICRRDLVACMWTAAKRGRVGAILWLEQRIREREEPTGKPLGKKAQAQLEAQNAGVGTEWETLLRPQSPPKQPPRAN
jgi:transcriptional regulator with XRE-family HTH domain